MANCGNCNSKLNCGCKKRTASDGKSCCVNCIKNYELKLKKDNKSANTIIKSNHSPGVILNVKAK